MSEYTYGFSAVLATVLLLGAAGCARNQTEIKLNDGRTLKGRIIGGTPRAITLEKNGTAALIPRGTIADIQHTGWLHLVSGRIGVVLGASLVTGGFLVPSLMDNDGTFAAMGHGLVGLVVCAGGIAVLILGIIANRYGTRLRHESIRAAEDTTFDWRTHVEADGHRDSRSAVESDKESNR